ncbi:MAG TPA: transcription termination/antitermination NusG family protein [Blastocatellia bacterium]|nr:transcription termination/antitermination NusG family protein [Blastocatellia bacterium]
MMSWYAIHTKPRQEDVVERNLQRWGLVTFNPKLEKVRYLAGKRRSHVGPLFPGYIFSRFDPAVSLRLVRYAHGVRDVVRSGGEPVPVADEIIELIAARMCEGYVRIEPQFRPGDRVRIESGPLSGLTGIFEREMSDRQRVMILLAAIEYHARVIVEKSCLRKL